MLKCGPLCKSALVNVKCRSCDLSYRSEMLLFSISVLMKPFLSYFAVWIVVVLVEIWQKSVVINIPVDVLS